MSETDDVVALWRLQAAYADAVTRRAWPELHGLFRPDAVVRLDTVTSPLIVLRGPGQVGEFIAAAIERYDHFAFVILNAVVNVDNDGASAHGRIFMCEIRHDRDDDVWHNAYGVYEDDYVHLEDRWWYAARRYRSIARTGPEAAVFGVPEGLAAL